MSARLPATVRALSVCTCRDAWYACRCDTASVTTYTAIGDPWTLDGTSVPSPAFIEYVAKLHPGATLVYVDAQYVAHSAR